MPMIRVQRSQLLFGYLQWEGYFALIITKVCSFTKATTYRECWHRSMGEHGGLAVSIANTLNPAMGDLAYAAILSQTLQSLLESVGLQVTRIQSLLFITIFALLPLCLMKNLYALAPFSAVGTSGVILTAAAMVLRCVDGSYQPGGKYYDDIRSEYRPSFGSRNQSMSTAILPLVCMLFQAFVMHYNVSRFYSELENASVHRFAIVLGGSFGLSSLLYIAIAVAGFLTFGENTDSYVLNNYPPSDGVATVCRLAIAFSTLLTFPLAFMGFRDGVLDIFGSTPADLRGFLATAIVFVFPALMYRETVAATLENSMIETVDAEKEWRLRNEVKLAYALMIAGVALGLIGALEAVQSSKA